MSKLANDGHAAETLGALCLFGLTNRPVASVFEASQPAFLRLNCLLKHRKFFHAYQRRCRHRRRHASAETDSAQKTAAAKTSAAKSLQIYIDGEFFDQADAKISVFDHGLLYGDGIFEGIRFYNGRVFRMEEHMDRLWESARSICLEIPISRQEMDEALLETIRQNDLRDGYVRLIVTRGVGNLGLNPAQCKEPSIIIIASTIALYPEEIYQRGLTVVTVADPPNGPGNFESRDQIAQLPQQRSRPNRGRISQMRTKRSC